MAVDKNEFVSLRRENRLEDGSVISNMSTWCDSLDGDDEEERPSFTPCRSQFDMYDDSSEMDGLVASSIPSYVRPPPSRRCEKENLPVEKQTSKRKAKTKDGVCNPEKSTSRRKMESQRSDLESNIRHGSCENLRRLQECMDTYEDISSSFMTHGLLIRYNEKEDGELYAWLHSIGFELSVSDDSVLQLPSHKIPQLKAILNRHTNKSNPKLLQNGFFEAANQSTSKKSESKHTSSKKKNTTKSKSKGLKVAKSANIMKDFDNDCAGNDTKLRLNPPVKLASNLPVDKSVRTDRASFLPPANVLPPSSHVGGTLRTFGKSGCSSHFSTDAFGAGVKAGASSSTPAHVMKKNNSGSKSEVIPTHKLGLDLSVDISHDSEDSTGGLRPLSTSMMGTSRYSMSGDGEGDGDNRRDRDRWESACARSSGSRKSPRLSKRDTPSPTPNWTSDDTAVSDSVIKKFDSIAIADERAKSLEKQRDVQSFSEMMNRQQPSVESLMKNALAEFDEDIEDEKDGGIAMTTLPPSKPSFSRSSSLDLSGEHSGKEDFHIHQQSLIASPNAGNDVSPPCTLPPSLHSQFRRCSSREDSDEEKENKADIVVKSNKRAAVDVPCANNLLQNSNEKKAYDIPAFTTAKSVDWESVRDPPRYGKKLRKTRTDPYQKAPQTPELCKAFSQNDVASSCQINCNEVVCFSTPIEAVSCHTSGQKGNDFLVSDPALPFVIEMFREVFRTKPPKSPVVRESTSPYLFSALSNRKLSLESYASSDEKQKAKEKKNKAFLKRMSGYGNSGLRGGSSFNPSTASKAKTDRTSIVNNQDLLVKTDGRVQWDDLNVKGGNSGLDQHSFRGMVVGGIYENCFDDNIPVVSAPSTHDKRVVGVQLVAETGNLVSLKVYVLTPGSEHTKAVSLGVTWVCYKISTGGFLVAKSEILPYQACMCYFLPRHPRKWAIAMKNMSPKQQYDLASHALASPKSFLDASVVGGEDQLLGPHDREHNDRHSIDHFAADESKIYHDDDDLDSSQFEDEYTQEVCRKLHVSMATSSCGSLSFCEAPMPPKLRFSSHDNDDDDDDDSSLDFMRSTQASPQDDGSVFPCLNDDDDIGLDMSINELSLNDIDKSNISFDEARNCDWNNTVVFSNVLPFLFDFNDSYILEIMRVSKSWALECYKVVAAQLSGRGACQQLTVDGWKHFMSRYGDGKFLSAGACKDVFCVNPSSVNNQSSRGLEAVSVMDMLDLEERDVAESVSRELEISMLCSSLVSLNICPNLLQVYSIFQSAYPPSNSLWKRGKKRFPSTSAPSATHINQALSKLEMGEFQYIRMEFCSSGDLEEVVRARSSFDACHARSLLFQMCFSLYCCREQLSLRHYDVKLLNFFGTGVESLLLPDTASISGDISEDSSLSYIDIGFGDHVYALPTGSHFSSNAIVKLADFGTSSVGSATLSQPITVHQFTTLENTPPEYLFLGSHARECYSADTFCLGLSFFHLMSGEEPYEEHLKDVRCPPLLMSRLKKLWRVSDRNSQYYVISEVIESLDTSLDSSEDSMNVQNVLYDTFYRYLVLFDISSSTADDGSGDLEYPYSHSNAVLKAAVECLGLEGGRFGGSSARNISRGRRECIQQFNKDRAMWSIHSGHHQILSRVRNNLSLLGEGSLELLCSMVNLDASKRCSLHEALTSPLFHSLRLPENVAAAYDSVEHNITSTGRSFMHYRNKQFLPIF